MNISIITYREVISHSQSFIAYQIRITYKDWQNTVEKRYSELLELHQVMQLIQKVVKQTLPTFPEKMGFKHLFNRIGNQDLESRRRDLEVYMQELITTNFVKKSRFFADFIGLPMRLRDEWIFDEPD